MGFVARALDPLAHTMGYGIRPRRLAVPTLWASWPWRVLCGWVSEGCAYRRPALMPLVPIAGTRSHSGPNIYQCPCWRPLEKFQRYHQLSRYPEAHCLLLVWTRGGLFPRAMDLAITIASLGCIASPVDVSVASGNGLSLIHI